MNHLRQQFPVWGTIVDVDIASSLVSEDGLNQGMQQVIDFCKQVDSDFSTYIDTSWVTRLRTNQIEITSCPPSVQEVWELCLQAKHLTDGAFDPWAVEGGFDPSGLVKGWAAEVGAQMLVEAGIENVLINASGDIVLRGGKPDGGPWNIGIASPDDVEKYVKFFDVTDGSVATSGDYENPSVDATKWALLAEGANAAYTPTTSSHWASPAPTTIFQAIDRIAAAVYGLLSNTAIP